MKVSLILATLGRDLELADFLKSLVNQTYKNFELIIIDDGSTDHTQDIVASFQDPRIIYHWQENQERSAARNTGISLSQGPYITFLDGDDYYLKEKLACQVAMLDRLPEIGMVVSGWIQVDDQLNHLEEVRPWILFPSPTLRDWLFSGLTIIGANLIRRGHLERIGGFDKDLPAMEDTFLWRKKHHT